MALLLNDHDLCTGFYNNKVIDYTFILPTFLDSVIYFSKMHFREILIVAHFELYYNAQPILLAVDT